MDNQEEKKVTVTVVHNGPYSVEGEFLLIGTVGTYEE